MRAIVVYLVALITVPATMVCAQDRNSCVSNSDTHQAIQSCSNLIRANPNDAAAYHFRGNALARNGDHGQALADYTRAIQINPSYAPAYESRASAYTNKGDYTHALADATKAAELAMIKEQPKVVSVISKAPAKARPRVSRTASAKQPITKHEAPAFNPFQDRSGAP